MTPRSDVVAFAHRSGLDLARGVADALARRAPRRLAVQASTFFPSPFDQAAVLTLDRGGDFLSTTLQVGAGSRLVRLAQIPDPDSLGKAIRRSPWYLGFEPNADEGKTMGLAPMAATSSPESWPTWSSGPQTGSSGSTWPGSATTARAAGSPGSSWSATGRRGTRRRGGAQLGHEQPAATGGWL